MMVSGSAARRTIGVLVSIAAFGTAVWWALRESAPEFAEVRGAVTLDGKPVEDIAVRFVPDEAGGHFGPTSSGYTDGDGKYAIRCDKYERDGTAPGSYRVVILDLSTISGVPRARQSRRSENGSAVGAGNAAWVLARYADVSSTPLRNVVVAPGTQEINFELAPAGLK